MTTISMATVAAGHKTTTYDTRHHIGTLADDAVLVPIVTGAIADWLQLNLVHLLNRLMLDCAMQDPCDS